MHTEESLVNISLAQAIATTLGIQPKVYPYYDDDKSNSIDILECTDPLDNLNVFYCTIGLSDIPVTIFGEEQNFGVEVLLTAQKENSFAGSLLSTASFFIGKDNWEARPGAVFNNLISLYDETLEMKHLYFTEPFFCQEQLEQVSVNIEEKNVLFLLAVPISENELQYKEENGDEAFEALLFSENTIDLSDFKRKSVL
ncbi:suppressor of fused domain protein [Flavobacterium enshiense]|uniref:suppressor of fused domain protein n=1 Tax=Flavobacterium enshiense TaxID=1341165 RepID=UPI00345DD685